MPPPPEPLGLGPIILVTKDDKSRVTGDCYARFCCRPGGETPPGHPTGGLACGRTSVSGRHGAHLPRRGQLPHRIHVRTGRSVVVSGLRHSDRSSTPDASRTNRKEQPDPPIGSAHHTLKHE